MIGAGLNKYRHLGLLILRVGIGLAFIAHGWPKMAGGRPKWWELGQAFPVPPPTFWGFIGAMTEFGGGILLLLGLFTRPACVLLTIQMIVAMSVHLRSPLPTMHAFSSGWSHAMEDGVVFLAMIFLGPGRYSVDSRWEKNEERPESARGVEPVMPPR